MFLGEYDYKVDEKGRVLIPPKFRPDLKWGVVFTPGAEKCITAYSFPDWKKLAAALTTTSITPSKQRRLNRAVFAMAFHLMMDPQGRVALPQQLREYAEIGEDIIMAGVNTYFEVWNKEAWEEERAISQDQAWQNIESLEKRP